MTDAHSIWLVPDRSGAAYRRLDDIIADRARAYPDAPDFDPHVTLLGGVDVDREAVTERARELAHGCGPLDLDFGDASCSTTTHQCVFVLITPSAELLELRRAASAAFGRDERMYVPHVSLVYGDLDVDERVREVASIDAASLPDSVRIDTLAVVDTGGSVPEWETVATYSL